MRTGRFRLVHICTHKHTHTHGWIRLNATLEYVLYSFMSMLMIVVDSEDRRQRLSCVSYASTSVIWRVYLRQSVTWCVYLRQSVIWRVYLRQSVTWHMYLRQSVT